MAIDITWASALMLAGQIVGFVLSLVLVYRYRRNLRLVFASAQYKPVAPALRTATAVGLGQVTTVDEDDVGDEQRWSTGITKRLSAIRWNSAASDALPMFRPVLGSKKSKDGAAGVVVQVTPATPPAADDRQKAGPYDGALTHTGKDEIQVHASAATTPTMLASSSSAVERVESYGRMSLSASERAKVIWSRWFLLFVGAAIVTQALGWVQSYIKCLDTSGSIHKFLTDEQVDRMCVDTWGRLSLHTKESLWVVYYTATCIGVASFQYLVVERYRMLGPLFPRQLTRVWLPVYATFYALLSVANYALGMLEFYTSRHTLIERGATLNTISSSAYALFYIFSGGTDIALAFWIHAIVSRSYRNAERDRTRTGWASTAATGSRPAYKWRGDVVGRLRRLKWMLVVIPFLDLGIISMTAIKHLHPVWAWELSSVETSLALIHCFVTLVFMQLLAVILRPSQPQFEFADNRDGAASPAPSHSDAAGVPSRRTSDGIDAPISADTDEREAAADVVAMMEIVPAAAAAADFEAGLDSAPAAAATPVPVLDSEMVPSGAIATTAAGDLSERLTMSLPSRPILCRSPTSGTLTRLPSPISTSAYLCAELPPTPRATDAPSIPLRPVNAARRHSARTMMQRSLSMPAPLPLFASAAAAEGHASQDALQASPLPSPADQAVVPTRAIDVDVTQRVPQQYTGFLHASVSRELLKGTATGTGTGIGKTSRA